MGVIIGGIDPGYSTGGLVVLEAPNHVIYARSFAPKPSEVAETKALAKTLMGDKAFNDAALRSEAQVQRILAALDDSPVKPDLLAVESFVDQPQYATTMRKGLWKTPFLMGHLAAGLAERGYSVAEGNLIYQDAGVVLKHFKLRISLLKRRDHATMHTHYPGSDILTNSHMRSAFAHAAWRALRLPRKEL